MVCIGQIRKCMADPERNYDVRIEEGMNLDLHLRRKKRKRKREEQKGQITSAVNEKSQRSLEGKNSKVKKKTTRKRFLKRLLKNQKGL